MLETKIRKASVEDIPLIHKMAEKAFPDTYKDILTEAQIGYMMDWMYSERSLHSQMENEEHTYYIAYQDDTPAGYVSVQPEAANIYHLQKIYVLPEFQGKHLGKVLFETAISAIKEMHPAPCKMRLNVNRYNKSLGFYQHMGMKKIDEGDFPIGAGWYMNDYIMEIDI